MTRKNNLLWALGFLATTLLLPTAASARDAETPAWLDSEEQVTSPPAAGFEPFVPETAVKSCYSQCLYEQVPMMCEGLTGAEHHQCVFAVAEGCRCMCGLWCP